MDKKHILEEIKRTAQANGGKPLGKERFYRVTGITESDWIGKHWARWGDAIRESGLEPNQMQGAHDESHLIDKFIELMRELRKVPTATEIKMKARATEGFPWHSSFARFGSKQQFIARIQKYCRGREGYDDIIAICVSIPETRRANSSEDVELEESFGFVYLMKSGRHYKIGKTNHLGGRERDLAIQLPEKVNTLHSIRTDDPAGIEAYWHKRFEAKRKNGEWFDLNPADVTAFKRRKFM